VTALPHASAVGRRAPQSCSTDSSLQFITFLLSDALLFLASLAWSCGSSGSLQPARFVPITPPERSWAAASPATGSSAERAAQPCAQPGRPLEPLAGRVCNAGGSQTAAPHQARHQSLGPRKLRAKRLGLSKNSFKSWEHQIMAVFGIQAFKRDTSEL